MSEKSQISEDKTCHFNIGQARNACLCFVQLSCGCSTAFLKLKRLSKRFTTLKETTTFPWGGGVLKRCSRREVGQTLTLFKTEIADFATLFKAEQIISGTV